MGNTLNWISVKDRLPEKDMCGRYLIYVENIANFNHLLDNVFIGVWCFDDWVYDGWECNRVTYWMPLPEPPKEQNT